MDILKNKLHLLLIVLLFGFSQSSCNKDDDKVNNNQAPNSFDLNEVADGTGLLPQLSWDAATDPEGEPVSYQVYLDTQNPPQTSIANGLGVNTFNVQNELEPETSYYWMVLAKDTNGNTRQSDIDFFTTRDMTTEESLVGTWYYESIAGQPPLSECVKTSNFIFTANLYYTLEAFNEDSNGDCVPNSVSGTYEVALGNQINLTGNSGVVTWTIQSLTQTELVVEISSNGDIVTLVRD